MSTVKKGIEKKLMNANDNNKNCSDGMSLFFQVILQTTNACVEKGKKTKKRIYLVCMNIFFWVVWRCLLFQTKDIIRGF